MLYKIVKTVQGVREDVVGFERTQQDASDACDAYRVMFNRPDSKYRVTFSYVKG